MLIPFEPKIYMSDMDMKINQATQWNSGTIRENFRHQLDNQMKQKLQAIGTDVSFYIDSAKTWKDLMYVYKSTTLSSELVDKSNKTVISRHKLFHSKHPIFISC